MYSKKIVLDYDDYCDQEPENCIDFLEQMVEEIPDIKVNLFTIAANRGRRIADKDWVNRTKRLIESGNLLLGIHGLFHTHLEFENFTLADAYSRIQMAENTLADLGLPYIKVFKGPHWGISIGTFQALDQLGYTHVFNHEDHRRVADIAQTGVKAVYYNWNLKDDAPEADLLVAHGHTHNVCGNGIRETWEKVRKWYKNQEEVIWLSATEV